MRIGVSLGPTASWSATLEAAAAAEASGLDSIGLLDHYHSAEPELAYLAGWSAHGALAALTERIGIVPLVVNAQHHELGVLAKESSFLAIASGGRFELGIGAGDWAGSFAAWGRPFPPRAERFAELVDKLHGLRLLWAGQPVSVELSHLRLAGATISPQPEVRPRVIVGVGHSVDGLGPLLPFVDEINVYADPAVVDRARAAVTAVGAAVDVSVFVAWDWDRWPAAPEPEIAAWASRGVERLFVMLGGPDMVRRVEVLAAAQAQTGGSPRLPSTR